MANKSQEQLPFAIRVINNNVARPVDSVCICPICERHFRKRREDDYCCSHKCEREVARQYPDKYRALQEGKPQWFQSERLAKRMDLMRRGLV